MKNNAFKTICKYRKFALDRALILKVLPGYLKMALSFSSEVDVCFKEDFHTFVGIMKKVFGKIFGFYIYTSGIFACFVLLLLVSDVFAPFQVPERFSHLIYDQSGRIIYADLNEEDRWRFPAHSSDISPQLKKMLLYKEDRYFYYHPGINPFAVLRALSGNIISGEITSGASTITMQLARMLKPAPRNYTNKIKEMWHALQLELHYSKEEIINLYLNHLPYGGNIEGVKTASWFYYGCLPQNLSTGQLTSLMLIPNQPNAFCFENPKALLAKRNQWLHRLYSDGIISRQEMEDSEPLPSKRRSRPNEIPHFARYLRGKFPNKTELYSAIDMNVQYAVSSMMQSHIGRYRLYGPVNSAVVVLDNRSHEIIAYQGSVDFYDAAHQGEVDGAIAVRSPGSTLKPFLYGLCMDKGMITPLRKIMDLPLELGAWSPENYDHKYRGMIPAAEALAQSLNVPAVRLLRDYGLNDFLEALNKAKCSRIYADKNKLGLSVILGGCGTTLMELVQLYSVLANEGKLIPLGLLRHQTEETADSILSAAAAYMITDILTQHDRPDLPTAYRNTSNLPPIAWKTGTSFGRHDAWSIGYNKNYTIGVWIGDFKGSSIATLNGANFASPLLFSIFNAIDNNQKANWFAAPKTLSYRMLCEESGLLPTEHCDHLVMDMYIPTVSDMHVCDAQKAVFVDEEETMSYCSWCLPERGYKQKWYPNPDAELIRFYEDQGMIITKVPPHNSLCSRISDGNKPQIISPQDRMRYILPDASQKIALMCNAAADVHKVFWFVDNEFVGSVEKKESLFFSPSKGTLKIVCTDDRGRSSEIHIEVLDIN